MTWNLFLDFWTGLLFTSVWTCGCDPGHRLAEQLSLHSDRRERNKAELGINQVTSGGGRLRRQHLPAFETGAERTNQLHSRFLVSMPTTRALHTGSMLSLAQFPVTIAGERALTHSTPAHSGSDRERSGCVLSSAQKHTLRRDKGESTDLIIFQSAFKMLGFGWEWWRHRLPVEKRKHVHFCLTYSFNSTACWVSAVSRIFLWMAETCWLCLLTNAGVELTKQGWLHNECILVWRKVRGWHQV